MKRLDKFPVGEKKKTEEIDTFQRKKFLLNQYFLLEKTPFMSKVFTTPHAHFNHVHVLLTYILTNAQPNTQRFKYSKSDS